MNERVALLGRDAERIGQVGTTQPLTHRQLEDESIAFIETGRGRAQHRRQLFVRDGFSRLTRIVGGRHVRNRLALKVGGNRALAFLGTTVDLVAQHGVEPRFETIGFAQLIETLGRDDEDVLNHVGCIVTIGEHRSRRVVQTRRVTVVDRRQRRSIAAQVGGDELGVGRGGHGSSSPRRSRDVAGGVLAESLPDDRAVSGTFVTLGVGEGPI